MSWPHSLLSLTDLLRIYGKGFLYDLAVVLFISSFYTLYLLLISNRINRSAVNRVLTYVGFFLVLILCLFSFFAEIAFWNEFDSRFNFIAVDYLVYTYEVVNNINQTYPLPILFSSMIVLAIGIIVLLKYKRVFYNTFYSNTQFSKRLKVSGFILSLSLIFLFILKNEWADQNRNRYVDELSKSGIFSFFAAFRNNELDYEDFYLKAPLQKIFPIVRQELSEPRVSLDNNPFSIRRIVSTSDEAVRPNVIMVTIESLSADFMEHFGNTQHLMPVLDSIADEGILFTDMYSTGTRTVRGMEALSLSIPPTPGNSIVRRTDNENLYCIGTVFKGAGYSRTFFYGGDGYFDNMNAFFGNNGFDIVDRGSRVIPGEHFQGTRQMIGDKDVHFENAWGICDEDLYDAVIRDADRKFQGRQLFYDFVMTTSNHRPFSYPPGKIDIRSGSGREGAVKYTDYAIGEFLNKIKNKPWFSNTVIIFVADHCAGSAGKNEINVENYHIPCIFYNLKSTKPRKIDVQCSQIDLYATLFGILGWSYTSNFYGKDVLLPSYRPRAYIGTYQKLGYLEQSNLVILSPRQKANEYHWNRNDNSQVTVKQDTAVIMKAVGLYQSASYLFKNRLLREEPENK